MKAIDEWWPHAACRGKPLRWWFSPPSGDHTWNRARRICSTCPVCGADVVGVVEAVGGDAQQLAEAMR